MLRTLAAQQMVIVKIGPSVYWLLAGGLVQMLEVHVIACTCTQSFTWQTIDTLYMQRPQRALSTVCKKKKKNCAARREEREHRAPFAIAVI
jgi:hypothetical protein